MPWVTAVAPFWSAGLLDAILNALTVPAVGAFLNAPKVHLFKNNLQVGPNNAVGDFTESTFPGYAPVVMGALGGPVTTPGKAQAKFVDADFICTGAPPAPGELVYGYYITDGAGLVLYSAETFAQPLNITASGDFVSLEVIWPEPAQHSAA